MSHHVITGWLIFYLIVLIVLGLMNVFPPWLDQVSRYVELLIGIVLAGITYTNIRHGA